MSKHVYKNAQMVDALAEVIGISISNHIVPAAVARMAEGGTDDDAAILPTRLEDVEPFADLLAEEVVRHTAVKEAIERLAAAYIRRLMVPK